MVGPYKVRLQSLKIPSTKLPSQRDPSSPRECWRELLMVGQLDEEPHSVLVYYPVIIYIYI